MNETISIMSAHWLEIVTAVYLIGMILYGHYRGFIRLAVSVAAMIIVLVSVKLTMPYVMDWMKNDTPIYEHTKEKMTERMKMDAILEQMQLTGAVQREDEWVIIDELPLPAQIKDRLAENNNSEVYKELGVQYFQEYVAGYLTDTILRAVTFVSLFVIGYVLLRLLVKWLDLIAKLPILSGMNQIAGAILGGAQAMLIIWVASLLVTALSGTSFGNILSDQIEASKWLTWIYEHNLLSYLFLGWIYSII